MSVAFRDDPPENSQTAKAALKRISYGGKLVAHGLRSIASNALNEQGFNADVFKQHLLILIKMKSEEHITAQLILTKELS